MDQDRRKLLAAMGGVVVLGPMTAALPSAAMAQDKPLVGAAGASASPAAMPPYPAGSAQPQTDSTALRSIGLSRPRSKGGLGLMEALSRRRSTREFSPRPLSRRHLGELLWAACGVNRSDGHRTAPSWRGVFAVDVYAVLKEGAYRYDVVTHRLLPHKAGDYLALTGTQDFVATAPLNLLMVADFSRMKGGSVDEKKISAAADSACMGENVYLYCASEGLGTVFRGNVDRQPLHQALGFSADQYISYAQTVGYLRSGKA